jgi:hypothetical protein
MPRVVVEGRYVYETDLELHVGDEVLLPASWSGEWIGTVTALSSDYGGPCKRIVRVVRGRTDAERRDAALAAVPVAGFRPGATVEVSASCGHKVLLHVQEVNRIGRPTHTTYTCETCGGVPHSVYLGSADAWRWQAAGLD